MSSKIGVAIVNWNNSTDTAECLRNVAKLAYDNFFTIVVDNGSTDDSAKQISSKFPSIPLISLKKNLGYPSACNAGIKYCINHGASYVFLLNNDVIVDKDALSHLIKTMEKNKSIGIAAPKVYFYHDRSLIFSAGGRVSMITAQNYGLGYGEKDSSKYSFMFEVDYASGCALMIDSNLIQAIGYMDLQYFMYYDEIDFCVRAKKKGFKIMMVPDAKVWHKVSATAKKYSGLKEYYVTRNRFIFIRKFQRGLRLSIFYIWFMTIWFPYNLATLFARSRKLRLVESFLHGIADGLKTTYW